MDGADGGLRGKALDDPLVRLSGVAAEAEAVMEARGSALPELNHPRYNPESTSVMIP